MAVLTERQQKGLPLGGHDGYLFYKNWQCKPNLITLFDTMYSDCEYRNCDLCPAAKKCHEWYEVKVCKLKSGFCARDITEAELAVLLEQWHKILALAKGEA